MATVETARGPLDTADLGRVLMHEYVFVLSIEIQQNYPEEWGDEDSRVADAVRRLTELKAAGIDTILDPTLRVLADLHGRCRNADTATLHRDLALHTHRAAAY
jgi:predicted metal-dependent phosphotriesterase family hydrolase